MAQLPGERRAETEAVTITVHDLAVHRGVEDVEVIVPAEYAKVGLPFMGTCGGCQTVYGARKIHPSKAGVLKCAKCIKNDGYATCSEANEDIFGVDENSEILAAVERVRKWFPNMEVIE
jgi:hypothetical protein